MKPDRGQAAPPRRAAARPRRLEPPREVRIVGGQWKRSKLPVLDLPGLRPTPDRVRETLFNWLGASLDGWRCADVFAGTGALGFEAASRGAVEVVLVERESRAVRSLLETRERLKAEATVRVERGEALTWLGRAAPSSLDVVFLDPPFDAGIAPAALRLAAPLVVPGGFVYVESSEPLPPPEGSELEPWRASRAGQVSFQLFRRRAGADAAATLPDPDRALSAGGPR